MQFNFDGQAYPFSSRRRVIYARRGMVCTSQPLSAQAGLSMLQQGGNAIDAAIATAICQTIVEPTNTGLGSDCFALVWVKDKLYGLNGSGYAPTHLTAEAERKAGNTVKIPFFGWEAMTIPGAAGAWAELHRRFGKLPFAKLFEPAIDYAENGFPVSPIVARFWQAGMEKFLPYKEHPAIKHWFKAFVSEGKAPQTGELMRLPDHAKTLRSLAASYCESMYRGELAEKIVELSDATGGYLTKEDLADYHPEWQEPIHINYRGYDVWEMPPNGHGITALMALNILKGFDFPKESMISAERYHKQIEAMKLAFADGMKYIADPRYMKTKVEELLSEEYTAERRALIGHDALDPVPGTPFCGGTVYLNAADDEGNMVSFIQSNYKDFGCGIVVPGYGLNLNCRAAGFSLDPESDDYLLPRKKPYHTIIPGFLTRNGEAVGPFGVMGAYMQPQGHVQVVMNTVDFLLNPQASLDAPRWQWIEGKKIWLEDRVPQEIIEELRKRGHEIEVKSDYTSFGRGEIIWCDDSGVLAGATEPRADGTVAAW
ncbi:MAG: gamma-glutamyltransferase family protein [Phascolarctobacterium sp.]|nr:gamma-glutamyltransferase family protein [Phascolarctobacterium sp.]